MRSSGLRWALNPITGVLRGKEETHRETGRRVHVKSGGDWSDVAASRAMPGTTKTWERQGGSPPTAFGGSLALHSAGFQTSTSATVTEEASVIPSTF